MIDPVHQFVHGYEHGHQLLASSTELPLDEMDLVTRLSDLSGSMVPGEVFEPYVSFYPLPSGTHYVVAKTWEDTDAPRAGCVLTHSLVLPLDVWMKAKDIGTIAALLRRPDRSDLRSFSFPVSPGRSIDLENVSDPNSDDFILTFFGEGIRPLVWFGPCLSESYAWRIVSALWPSLRATFACCTFALQPRTLEDRPFDLMFAPASARSRFVDFDATHIVGTSTEVRSSPSQVEPWARRWREHVFGGSLRPSSDIVGLSAGLDPAPTSIRKVFLFLDLQEKAASAPLAAIGALDVLEGLGCEKERAQALITMLVTRTLDSVRVAPPDWALEMLCLVGLRLDRVNPAFVRATVHTALTEAVRRCVSQDAGGAVMLAERFSTRDLGRLPSALLTGLAEAIAASPNASTLEALACAPHVGRNLVDVSPALTYELLLGGRRVGVAFSDVLVDWYRGARDSASRSKVRTTLVPLLADKNESALLQELLKDMQPDELPTLCGAAASQIVDPDLGRLFCEYVGETSSVAVVAASREYVLQSCAALTFMVAGALPLSPNGLQAVLASEGAEHLIAPFVDRILRHATPQWLRAACGEPSLWACLLKAVDDPFASSVMSQLATGLDRSAISRCPEHMLPLERAPSSVQYHAVRQILLDYLESEHADLESWISTDWCAGVLTKDASLLRAVIGDGIATSQEFAASWVAAWKILEGVSRHIKQASGSVVEVCDFLLWRRPWPWPPQTTSMWVRTLANLAPDQVRHEVACTQAIRFALDNTRVQLAPVVAEAFYAVHEAARRTQSRPSWDFLGLTDWDKAGELRRRIVDAFYYSPEWEPEYFILAARETWLLRKLSKRMMKQWRGVEYLQRAYSRLRPGRLTSELHDILQHPEYPEDWD